MSAWSRLFLFRDPGVRPLQEMGGDEQVFATQEVHFPTFLPVLVRAVRNYRVRGEGRLRLP